jgi:hypothetical protein
MRAVKMTSPLELGQADGASGLPVFCNGSIPAQGGGSLAHGWASFYSPR